MEDPALAGGKSWPLCNMVGPCTKWNSPAGKDKCCTSPQRQRERVQLMESEGGIVVPGGKRGSGEKRDVGQGVENSNSVSA